jgi:hypothetical protein
MVVTCRTKQIRFDTKRVPWLCKNGFSNSHLIGQRGKCQNFSKILFCLCHGWGSSSLASHHGGPGSHPGHSMWDLWWTKWHWDKFFFKFSLSVLFHHHFPCSYITRGMNDGCSSNTLSDLIDMNNNGRILFSGNHYFTNSKKVPCANVLTHLLTKLWFYIYWIGFNTASTEKQWFSTPVLTTWIISEKMATHMNRDWLKVWYMTTYYKMCPVFFSALLSTWQHITDIVELYVGTAYSSPLISWSTVFVFMGSTKIVMKHKEWSNRNRRTRSRKFRQCEHKARHIKGEAYVHLWNL